LERQAMFYGSPGTGKTYWGKQTALDLAAIGAFGWRRPRDESLPMVLGRHALAQAFARGRLNKSGFRRLNVAGGRNDLLRLWSVLNAQAIGFSFPE